MLPIRFKYFKFQENSGIEKKLKHSHRHATGGGKQIYECSSIIFFNRTKINFADFTFCFFFVRVRSRLYQNFALRTTMFLRTK